jgi:hypothetical protein
MTLLIFGGVGGPRSRSVRLCGTRSICSLRYGSEARVGRGDGLGPGKNIPTQAVYNLADLGLYTFVHSYLTQRSWYVRNSGTLMTHRQRADEGRAENSCRTSRSLTQEFAESPRALRHFASNIGCSRMACSNEAISCGPISGSRAPALPSGREGRNQRRFQS